MTTEQTGPGGVSRNFGQRTTIQPTKIAQAGERKPVYDAMVRAADVGGGGGGAVTSVAGKTGAVTLVKSDVGLGNVDNTSDISKPVSTATQTALALKADAVTAPTTVTSGTTLTRVSETGAPTGHFNRPLDCAGGSLTCGGTPLLNDSVFVLNTHATNTLTLTGSSTTVTAAPGKIAELVYTGTAWVDPAPTASAAIVPSITLTASTLLTRASHINRTIYVDSTANVSMSLDTIANQSWQDGDFVHLVVVNPASGTVFLTSASGTLLVGNYSPGTARMGASFLFRYDAATQKFRDAGSTITQAGTGLQKQTLAFFPINYTGSYTDLNLTEGQVQLQCGNSGYNGAPNQVRVGSESTLFYAPANGSGAYSVATVYSQTGYYDNASFSKLALTTRPVTNTELIFPGSTRVGDRNRLEITGGQGLIGGSLAGNTTNGEWFEWDTNGNYLTYKGHGHRGEQRDTSTGTAAITINDNISKLILAGSGTHTVNFPAAPFDGQEQILTLETAYTGLTLAGNGKTLIGGSISVTAGSFGRWAYRAANTTWHRIG